MVGIPLSSPFLWALCPAFSVKGPRGTGWEGKASAGSTSWPAGHQCGCEGLEVCALRQSGLQSTQSFSHLQPWPNLVNTPVALPAKYCIPKLLAHSITSSSSACPLTCLLAMIHPRPPAPFVCPPDVACPKPPANNGVHSTAVHVWSRAVAYFPEGSFLLSQWL